MKAALPLLVLALAGCGTNQTQDTTKPDAGAATTGRSPGTESPPSPLELQIALRNDSISPPTIEAAPEQLIKLTVTNSGSSPHSLTFDIPGDPVEIAGEMNADEERTLEVTAPALPGEYSYRCPVRGHADKGEWGTLIVKS